MPIATPTSNESETEFVRRCMADEKMLEEFPDNGQRFAVCQSSWDESKADVQLKEVERPTQASTD
jgi:hypothetical protein